MILERIRIWNFRCIGTKDNLLSIKNDNPGIDLQLNPKVNVLIGANDSGKTAIIDAIKYILGTQTYDTMRLTEEDFYQNNNRERATELRIECIFSNFNNTEAGQFLEWISIKEGNNYELRIWLSATQKDNRIISNIRAGNDDEGSFIDGGAKDLLRATYLKPLRDAENELSPGYRSRLAQILSSHPVFIKEKDLDGKEKEHPLEKYFKIANKKVEDYFEKRELEEDKDIGIEKGERGGEEIKERIEEQTKSFLEQGDSRKPSIKMTNTELSAILRKLELALENNKSGLGTLNQLYMATELIFLKREDYNGLRLALIEELEAHLHPQAQLRVLKSLLNEENSDIQYILTTHSTSIGASIPLEYIKLCNNGQVYSLDKNSTELEEEGYQFLERFLDDTKANLFFAKGVIIVEGYSENIIIPAIAELIGKPLYKYGISIVNVGSKALLRYAKIFMRKDKNALPIKVAVVTDLDIKVDESGNITESEENIEKKRKEIEDKYNSNDGMIKAFCSPLYTLEYDIACGNLICSMHRAIQIAEEIKSTGTWITNDRVNEILYTWDKVLEEDNERKRAYDVYKPLLQSGVSKTITAQWFVKLLLENKENTMNCINQDKEDRKGIKYIIDAIEHVTNEEHPDK